MDTRQTDLAEEPLAETPEDVAILYSWANLHGAKYRDFSASRREYRAQVRHRAAEEAREVELKLKAEAEAAAAEAERVAREAERAARSSDAMDSRVDRDRALREAEIASGRAARERLEIARREEAAAMAEAAARRAEREIAEAHASAERQAASWQDSELRRRALAGPQPVPAGLPGDPYERPDHTFFEDDQYSTNTALEYTQPRRFRDETAEFAPRISGQRPAYRERMEVKRRPQGFRPDEASGMRPAYRPLTSREPLPNRAYPFERAPQVDFRQQQEYRQPPPAQQPYGQQQGYQQDPYYDAQRSAPQPFAERDPRADVRRGGDFGRAADFQRAPGYDRTPGYDREAGYDARDRQPQAGSPAWLSGGARTPAQPALVENASTLPDTLQYSRERVAARWFALKGVFEPGQQAPAPAEIEPSRELKVPVLAVFSLAGGVGKTSLLATLGRALSSMGEKVLLADTTSHGLLPYYFGASELRPGVVRTFSPPEGSVDAPIHLVSYDVETRVTDRAGQDALADEIVNNALGTQRILLDLNANSGWVIDRLSRLRPTVLVPVAPDMNSVISLQAVEKFFQAMVDAQGRSMQPYYVINQFDASLPLHLDVREVLRRQLGDRLLPIAVRRAPAVSEALAEGMTVVDYAPDAGVAEDYRNIANWLRSLAAPANQAFRNTRWSER